MVDRLLPDDGVVSGCMLILGLSVGQNDDPAFCIESREGFPRSSISCSEFPARLSLDVSAEPGAPTMNLGEGEKDLA